MVLLAIMLLAACSSTTGAASIAVQQLYGGPRSLSEKEKQCVKRSSHLQRIVYSAKSANELNDYVFGGTSAGASDLIVCFADRSRLELQKSFLESGSNHKVAECRADLWLKELLDRAGSGFPVRDLTAAPDFEAFADRVKAQCP